MTEYYFFRMSANSKSGYDSVMIADPPSEEVRYARPNESGTSYWRYTTNLLPALLNDGDYIVFRISEQQAEHFLATGEYPKPGEYFPEETLDEL